MKYKIFRDSIVFLVLSLISTYALAQENYGTPIKKGDLIISTGYGVPSALRVYLNIEYRDEDIDVIGYGPSILKVDYALSNKFTIGLNGFYNYSDVHWMANAKDLEGKERLYRHGVQVWEAAVNLRVNYYFLKRKSWNLYGGLGAGRGYANAETYTFAPRERIYINHRFPPPWNFEGTAGGKLFISEKIALYGEIGIGQGFLLYNYYFIPAALGQFGLSLRL